MDFKREWTQFALDAEVDSFGTGRACKAHNEEIRLLKQDQDTLKKILHGMIDRGGIPDWVLNLSANA